MSSCGRVTKYLKKALSPKELVELTKTRGLSFGDEAFACEFLGHVSFYRLKGYLLHFERKIDGNQTHSVPAGTTFERVIELYELDRRLRFLFFEALERIEISFRSAISNSYSLSYGAHWWLQSLHFDPQYHPRLLNRVKRELGVDQPHGAETRDREVYIKHYFDKYAEPSLPPSWMLCECMSLGVWSTIYQNLVSRDGLQAVARTFQVPHPVLSSWLHALSVTRNICAHHGRLWNRNFVIKPTLLKGHDEHFGMPANIYAQAFTAAYLLRRIHPGTDWHLRMKTVLMSCPAEERQSLGVPFKWSEKPFWGAEAFPNYEPKVLAPKGS